MIEKGVPEICLFQLNSIKTFLSKCRKFGYMCFIKGGHLTMSFFSVLLFVGPENGRFGFVVF